MNKQGETMFVRLCETLSDKGKLIPATEDIQNYIKSNTKDYYVSLYKYTQKHKEIFESKGTVAGINDVTTNKILFDFDSPSDPEIARKEAAQLVDKLKKLDFKEEHIGVWFSGNKGIHVEINTDKSFTPTEAKTLATKIAGDFSSFDSVVYNASRIIRVPNTAHPKTGLFKTKISIEELNTLTVDQIKDISKEQYKADPSTVSPVSEQVMLLAKEEIKNRDTKENTVINDFEPNRNPFKLSPWKLALFQGFYCQGQRSHALMILAATLKHKGLDRNEALAILNQVNIKQSTRHNQELFDEGELERNVIGQVFGQNWQGKTYAEENFSIQLQDYLTEIGIPRGVENKLELFKYSSQVFGVFQDFATNIDKNTIKTGIKSLDDSVQMTTSMLVGLLGAPSSGKSACAFEILKNTSLNNEKSVFFSMDMGAPLVYQRLAQKVSGYNSKRLFQLFKDKNTKEIEKIRYQIDQNYKNVHFSFKTALTVEAMREALLARQEQTGERVRLICIDYLECINEDISDSVTKTAMIARKLKDLANDFEACVLVLLQPAKRTGDVANPLLSYVDIKGSGTISEQCSIVLTMWRDGFNPKDVELDKFISFAAVKNRMGGLVQIDMGWDGLTGQITDLDEQEKEELKQMRAIKASNKRDEF